LLSSRSMMAIATNAGIAPESATWMFESTGSRV